MLEEERELVLGAEVLLRSEPDGADPVLEVDAKFGWSGADPSVAGEHDEIAASDLGHPFEVRSAERHLGQLRVAG